MNWNLFGLNPQFKEFIEANPGKTLIGLAWSMQWRFMVFIVALELIFFGAFFLIGLVFFH